jgi:hypothetical protein
MKKLLLPLILLAAFSACNKDKSEADSTSTTTTTAPDTVFTYTPPPTDTAMTRLALALGGMSLPGFLDSSDAGDISDWQEHARTCDKLWRKTDEKIPYMEKWSELYIPSKGVLFYPFAGADFLHADVFFPDVDTIIMVGLEPVGDIPRQMDVLAGDNRDFFGQLRSSLSSILNYSFFLTNEMAVDFISKLDGTLSAILHFAVRRDYLISSVKHIYIQADGRLTDKGDGLKGSQFVLLKDGKAKVVYYFSSNLMDGTMRYAGVTMPGMTAGNPLLPFLLQHNISATYLKAASYLLHNKSYATTRDFILGKSNLVLQDDSGIPLKYVDTDTWSVQAFGVYEGPISLFSSRYQRDMKQLYKTSDPLGLPFGIGYKLRVGTSNMQLFLRKSASEYVAPEPVIAEQGPEADGEEDLVEDAEDTAFAEQEAEDKPEKQSSRKSPKEDEPEAAYMPVSVAETGDALPVNLAFSGAYLIGCYAVVGESEAQERVSGLRDRNFEADYLYIPHYERSGKRMYRIFVGPFQDMDTAIGQLALVREFIPRAYIVKMP